MDEWMDWMDGWIGLIDWSFGLIIERRKPGRCGATGARSWRAWPSTGSRVASSWAFSRKTGNIYSKLRSARSTPKFTTKPPINARDWLDWVSCSRLRPPPPSTSQLHDGILVEPEPVDDIICSHLIISWWSWGPMPPSTAYLSAIYDLTCVPFLCFLTAGAVCFDVSPRRWLIEPSSPPPPPPTIK